MKFFIDTANVAEIKEGLLLGMVDGVTTNPSLIAKEKRGFDAVVEILELSEPSLELFPGGKETCCRRRKKAGASWQTGRN